MNIRLIPLFPLGTTRATPGAHDACADAGIDPCTLLERHHHGDWGDICNEDIHANQRALLYGGRLLSAYHLPEGTKVWVLTEGDRSATTVLLPHEY